MVGGARRVARRRHGSCRPAGQRGGLPQASWPAGLSLRGTQLRLGWGVVQTPSLIPRVRQPRCLHRRSRLDATWPSGRPRICTVLRNPGRSLPEDRGHCVLGSSSPAPFRFCSPGALSTGGPYPTLPHPRPPVPAALGLKGPGAMGGEPPGPAHPFPPRGLLPPFTWNNLFGTVFGQVPFKPSE